MATPRRRARRLRDRTRRSLGPFAACGRTSTQQGGTRDRHRVEPPSLSVRWDRAAGAAADQQRRRGRVGADRCSAISAAHSPSLPRPCRRRSPIAAGTSADQVVLVQVAAIRSGQVVDLREVVVQVPTDRVAALTMVLAESCYGQVTGGCRGEESSLCPQGRGRCQPESGSCGSNVVNPATLPPLRTRHHSRSGRCLGRCVRRGGRHRLPKAGTADARDESETPSDAGTDAGGESDSGAIEASADATPPCAASSDCPPGHACDVTSGACVNACSSTQKLATGPAATSTTSTCAPDTAAATCGVAGGTCADCTFRLDGSEPRA